MQMMPCLVVRSMQCWQASAEACHGQGECSFECVGFDSWYRGQRGNNPAIMCLDCMGVFASESMPVRSEHGLATKSLQAIFVCKLP